MLNTVKGNRKVIVSKDMEMKLKLRYAKLSWNGIEQNDSNSIFDDDNLDELDCYDTRFGGDVELDRSSNVDDNTTNEIAWITNQTAV